MITWTSTRLWASRTSPTIIAVSAVPGTVQALNKHALYQSINKEMKKEGFMEERGLKQDY